MNGQWRTQCGAGHCWRERHVLDFHHFSGIFPRGINFGDVDGLVEYNGQFLMMEWKTSMDLWDAIDGTGQDLMHERLVEAGPFTVLQIVGNPGTGVSEYCRIWSHLSGARGKWFKCNLAMLKQVISRWRDSTET